MRIKSYSEFAACTNISEELRDASLYPSSFGGRLIRGVNLSHEDYLDDPSKRKVSIGVASNDPCYRRFAENWVKTGIPDPTKSVHMFFGDTDDVKDSIRFFKMNGGSAYSVYPKEGAEFGFCIETRNGGLGSAWFSQQRTLKDFLGIDFFEFEGKRHYDLREEAEELEDHEWPDFMRAVTHYQKMLFDAGVVGKISYDDLAKMQVEKGIQVWTESTCHLVKTE